MTKSIILTAFAATASLSLAGTSMVPATSGKGGASTPPPITSDCPNFLTYNEVQLSYVHIDGDSAGSADGADLRVNYELSNGLFAYGDVAKVSGDFDNTAFDLGLGAILPIDNSVHLIGRAGYSYFDADDADSHGWHVAAGIRAQFACNWEVNAKVQYGDLLDFDNGDYVSYGAGLTYHFNDAFAILSEYVIGEDDTWSLRGGVAFKF